MSYDDEDVAWNEPGPSTPPSRRLRRSSSSRAPVSEAIAWAKDRQYAVLVDAGSSGSRLQVYSWKDPKVTRSERLRKGKGLKVLPKVEKGTQDGTDQEWQWKVEPGISSFGTRSEALASYLDPLFRRALEVIPKDQLSVTPVYVMATAGMRLLPVDQQEAVVASICSFLRHHTPFQLTGTCQDHVQIITGEEEGMLGWIAINYLMDGFHFKADEDARIPPQQQGTKPSKGKSTYGFLDMGGASTQIAFEPSEKALAATTGDAAEEQLVPITLKLLDGTQVTHNVFVTTFLGFGTNKARDRYEDELLHVAAPMTASAPTALVDPCLPTGSHLLTSNGSHPLSGTGSFTKCLTSLTPLLDKAAPCPHPPCLFHGIHVPPIDFSVNHFIGVSEYWFSSHDVFNLGGMYDFVQFQKAAEHFCAQPWSELKAKLPSKEKLKGEWGPQVDEHRLQMQCFKAAWMVTVLHDGIGIPRVIDGGKGKGDGKDHVDEAGWKAGQKNLADTDGNGYFQSVNEVEGTAVSWTLGKAVLEATKDIANVKTIEGPHSVSPGKASHADYRPWTDTTGLKTSLKKATSGSPLGPALALLAVALLLLFVLTRGASKRAVRTRSCLNKFLPCRRRRGLPSQGEYTLANMEEGADERTSSETEGFVLSDDSTSSRSSRRSAASASPGKLLSYIPLPVRRLLLRYSPAISPNSPRRTKRQSRRHRDRNLNRSDVGSVANDDGNGELMMLSGLSGVQGVRRAIDPNTMRLSRPSSPSISTLPSSVFSVPMSANGSVGPISRPASRASSAAGHRMSRTFSGNGQPSLISMAPLTSPLSQSTTTGMVSSRPTSPPSYFSSSTPSSISLSSLAEASQNRSTTIAWTTSHASPSGMGGASTPLQGGIQQSGPTFLSISQAFDVNREEK